MVGNLRFATRRRRKEYPVPGASIRPQAVGFGGIALALRRMWERLDSPCKLPRPTRSLPPCGGRSLLEGRAFPAAPLCPATPCMGAARLPLNRPRCGRRVGAVLRPAYRSRAVDCPADLIAGGRLVRPRLQGARPDGLAPQVPVYSWHLPTPTCARTAVPYGMGREGLSLAGLPSLATRFLPGLLARSARSLRPGAPRYHVLTSAGRMETPVQRRVFPTQHRRRQVLTGKPPKLTARIPSLLARVSGAAAESPALLEKGSCVYDKIT